MAQDILPCITNSECLTKLHVSVLHMSLITIAYRIVTRIKRTQCLVPPMHSSQHDAVWVNSLV